MNCFKYLPVALLFAAGVSTAPAQTVEESLAEGRAAFMSYDFKGAARHYATARKKARKKIPAELEEQERELMKAENFLERVEKLVILYSITVPKTDFFKAYNLPFSAGNIGNSDAVPF